MGNLPQHFPQEFPPRFPPRFSCKNFPQEFPARFSHKISHKIFPQDFPQDFPKLDPDWLASHHLIPNAKFPPITDFLKLPFSPPPCPARISHKTFPQDFPARFPTRFSHKISHKIFPSWILIGWLPITLFQMLNFHQSLTFLNCLFPLLLVPQEFPTRLSHKIFLQDFPQDFPTRFSCKISHKIFPQEFPARFSCKNFPQEFPARISCKIFLQEFPTRFSHKIFPSWILIGWLPITLFQMLNFHQSLPC